MAELNFFRFCNLSVNPGVPWYIFQFNTVFFINVITDLHFTSLNSLSLAFFNFTYSQSHHNFIWLF